MSDCQLFHFENSTDTAVIYQPLGGQTVKTLLKNQQFSSQDCDSLRQFIAELHQKGVYFRSLHCGNIVKTASGFGLIDIADLKIYAWPLWFSTRRRNFKRLAAYQDDMMSLGNVGWKAISTGYFWSILNCTQLFTSSL